MKKVERKFTTDRYEIVVVQFWPEAEDYKAIGAEVEVKQPYMLIGPPDGPLARFDGLDISVLQTLMDATVATPYGPPPGFVPRRRGACPPYPPA